MHTITVKKDELLATMRENRIAHVEEFQDATVGYKKEVVNQLSDALAKAETGEVYQTSFYITEPASFEKDYDQTIGMLEMSVDDEVELDANQYKQWVMDEWSWTGNFKNSTALYAGR